MKIAILGWGSLVWSPGCLRIETRWRMDGPRLPVEFARISSRNRLTLVIHPGVNRQRTLWAVSEHDDPQSVRDNLREREGTRNVSPIHAMERGGRCYGDLQPGVSDELLRWLGDRPDIEAAVWTGLGSNWEAERRCSYGPDDALRYLRGLKEQGISAEAENYVRNAPSQIMTSLRTRIEEELGWCPRAAGDVLTESES